MFSRRLSGTDSQVASLGTECNQNLKVCVYRLQRLLSFVGLLYSSRKVRSICLIILQTLTLYQRGWSGGAMVLGKLPVPGRPSSLSFLSSFSLSLGDSPI